MKIVKIEIQDEIYEALQDIAESCHMDATELVQEFIYELVTDKPVKGNRINNRKILLIKWILEIFRIGIKG